MENFSTTQVSNIAAITGVIVLLLNHFHINISSEEISATIGGLFAVGGIVTNWYHRYQKGDLTLAGVRK